MVKLALSVLALLATASTASAAALPPVAGRSVVAVRVSGVVFVRRPGGAFRRLVAPALVPTGSEIDTKAGVVRLTVARDSSGATDTISLDGGRFVVTQSSGAAPVTSFALSEPLTGCPKHAGIAARRPRPARRHVHAHETAGRYVVTGSYAATSVEGTDWTTTDACGATTVAVAQGAVRVRDLVTGAVVTLTAGQQYTAHARPSASGPASAHLRQLASPADTHQAAAFGVSGDSWLLVTADHLGWISHDAGTSWQPLTLGADAGAQLLALGPIPVDPNGAFWVGAVGSAGLIVLRVAPSGQVTRATGPLPASDTSSAGFTFPGPGGRVWLELDRNATRAGGQPATQISLIRLAADGSIAERREFIIDRGRGIADGAEETAAGLWVDYSPASSGETILRADGGAPSAISGGLSPPIKGFKFSDRALYPVLDGGSTVLATRGMSFDGGLNRGAISGPSLLGVRGDASLLVRNDLVLVRWSPTIWRASALSVPESTTDVFRTRDGLVALSGTRGASDHLWAYRGAIPAQPAAIGDSGAYSNALVALLNGYRNRASIPPLGEDARIARAAANHARYLALNHISPSLAGNYHVEQRGRPGFTGASPSDRCAAVGASCSDEVIESSSGVPQHPVEDWLASVFHRLPLTSAVAASAGAARIGHNVVMDIDSLARRGLSLSPVGFPVGRYGGPRSYQREQPDPLQQCLVHGQPVRNPGTPITFQLPTEDQVALTGAAFIQDTPLPDVLGIALTRSGRTVRGCTKVSSLSSPIQNIAFIPEGALARHATYRATARWRLNPSAPVTETSWTFTTG